MAQKRKIDSDEKVEPLEEDGEVERLRHTESWPLWIRNEFLRYWYIVGCLFLDAIAFLQVYLTPNRPIFLALALLIGLFFLEAFVYSKFWGRNRLRGDRED